MFKNAILYRVVFNKPVDFSPLPAFVPCGASQQSSSGFVPPRGLEHGALVESIGGERILRLLTEVKVVPSDAVKRHVADIAKRIEEDTGRRPGRKVLKEIKEQALLELLPKALTRRSALTVWISTKLNLMLIDSTGRSRADDVVTLLVRCIDGLEVQQVQTAKSPAWLMTNYLLNGADGNFSVDREVELHATDETKAVVKYNRHTLDIDQVRDHIRQGKVPTKLAITWVDRVSFALTDTLQLKRLRFLDVVFEEREDVSKDEAFDADVAIATGELSLLLPDLLDALEAPEGPDLDDDGDDDDLGI